MIKNTFIASLLLVVAACSSTTQDLNTSTLSTDFRGDYTRLIGRFDLSEKGKASFTWPGSRLEFRFEGTKAAISIASNYRVRFEVEIDGKTSDLWVESGDKEYSLASNLASGNHEIKLTRITESFTTITAFTSSPIVDGKMLPPPKAPARKLLVIGDSITAGYGVEGSSKECHYKMENSNQQLTYAALTADELNADLHAIAWSGIGAYRGYGEETPNSHNIITRNKRILADVDSSRWNPNNYQPDAVLINIGTNDYWQNTAAMQYKTQFAKLLDQIQKDYPQTPVYLIASPMLGGDSRSSQIKVLQSFENDLIRFTDIGTIESNEGYGCDYHPNIITNKRMASNLVDRLKTDLQW